MVVDFDDSMYVVGVDSDYYLLSIVLRSLRVISDDHHVEVIGEEKPTICSNYPTSKYLLAYFGRLTYEYSMRT